MVYLLWRRVLVIKAIHLNRIITKFKRLIEGAIQIIYHMLFYIFEWLLKKRKNTGSDFFSLLKCTLMNVSGNTHIVLIQAYLCSMVYLS